MTREEIEKKVIEIAAERGCVKPENVSLDSHFRNDLEYDSLSEVEFAMEVEGEFELSVPDEDVEKLTTVAAVVDFVVAHRGEATPATAASTKAP
jgi:acyl carrier protein